MVDRIDLLIAVAGIVVSVLGSSTALWMAISKKADREDLGRLETRVDHRIDGLETKLDALETKLETKIDSGLDRLETKIDTGLGRLEARLDSGLSRLEAKMDSLILRLVPEPLPRPEN